MLSQALAASTDMYKENARIMTLLDDKAQKTAGLAGIFLAAAFAFLRVDSLQQLTGATGRLGILLLIASVAFSLACVFMGGWVMWSRKLQTPPDPNKVLHVCDLLLKEPMGPSDARRENHIRDQIVNWNLALQVQDGVIHSKSWKLIATQILLMAAMVAVSALLADSAFSYIFQKQSGMPKTTQTSLIKEINYGNMH